MNLATGSMTFGRSHRFVFGSLIVALLAAAILTGVAVWQIGESGSSATAVEPVVAPAAAPAGFANTPALSSFVPADVPARSMLYIVGSEAEKQVLLQEADEAAGAEGIASQYVEPSVMVVGSPEQKHDYNMMLLELTIESASTLNIVDLRGGSPAAGSLNQFGTTVPVEAGTIPLVVVVGSQGQADALQAHFAADEMAAFLEGRTLSMRETNFLVIDPLDQEFLQLILNGQMEFGTVDIIDLRS